MPINWDPFVKLAARHQRFLLTTHVRPDGDGLGSMRGLAEALEQLGKQARMVIASPLPPRYAFLNGDGRIERFSAGSEIGAEAIVVMDTGTWNQLGEFGPFLKASPAAKLVIDHHPTQDELGAERLVDTSAEATGRLAFEAIEALGARLTPSMAANLFVALAMDTGWFRHSNASAATFELAGRLVAAGAQPQPLYDLLYEQSSVQRLRLIGLALGRLQTDASGLVAWTEVRLEDYPATSAVPADTEDLVQYTRGVAGAEVGLLFMEQLSGGVKVSFRSRGHDVGKLAEQFGGGGHRVASGATIQLPLAEVRTRVLEAVSAMLAAAQG